MKTESHPLDSNPQEVKKTEPVQPRKREGLRYTKERRKSRKRAKQRYRAACMENPEFKDVLQRKGTVITDYIRDRESKNLESVPNRSETPNAPDCEWCQRFREAGFYTCINCGKNLKGVEK
jgi:hypothetical protein